MKAYYSMFVQMKNRPCIVIGGGKVAERKIGRLLQVGAHLTVISPSITEQIRQWVDQQQIIWKEREYKRGDLEGYFLVIIATDQAEMNQLIYQEVNHQYQLVNVVDAPDLCTFIVPSTVTRGYLQISISTNGASPGLAKKIRQEIEDTFGEEYETYTLFLAEMREWILQQNLNARTRQYYFAKMLEDEILTRIKKGGKERVMDEIKQEIIQKRNV
ncbi:precorrin-2 dehydrogenase/sirohydrochlorin ferrochelatase family protein [Tepidibacillus fermentans]|uniref:precorrin-2 dehydrogenase n=1 Tax=Tepidibacillus fermentans TaxID=1281767 RepID=A0A4R3KIN7_9BACI|nr:bifunctional precorrin-2 dehydrogenase/sirohydrochlorin ferrochelatase [Tepidibacillus fermentans]TCS83473.1 precorrin-2 dehydrogenase [Tepidibacillus fermentans]